MQPSLIPDKRCLHQLGIQMQNLAIQVIHFAPQLADEYLASGESALHFGQLGSSLVCSGLLIFERLCLILQRVEEGGKLLMEPIVRPDRGVAFLSQFFQLYRPGVQQLLLVGLSLTLKCSLEPVLPNFLSKLGEIRFVHLLLSTKSSYPLAPPSLE